MKILLTGHRGFIGKNIHNELYGSHELFCFEKDDLKKRKLVGGSGTYGKGV